MQGPHQGKPLRLVLATLATALLYALAHPPWSWWPLALVATAPVSAVLLDPRSRVRWTRAAAAGFAFGCVSTWMLVGAWSWQAAREFFAGSGLAAFGFVASLPVIASGIALQYALLFALVARLAGLGATAGVVGSAALWAATEIARTNLGYGNPWGAMAAALVQADAALSTMRSHTPVADLLALGGPPLVAVVASAVGAALGLACVERRNAVARGRALAAGFALVVPILVVSGLTSDAVPDGARDDAIWAGDAPATDGAGTAAGRGVLEPLRVALVQPGLGRSRLWEGAGARESLERLVELTRGLGSGPVDLVVWPENALPFLLDANADERDALRALARERGSAILAGGSHSSPAEGGRANVFVSAFLFPADGGEPLVYDKRVLLPFVEIVPWWIRPFLVSRWQGAYAKGRAAGPETGAGGTPDLFSVGRWRIAPLLCLEAVYPAELASRAGAGADLLVNLSNDSWFDRGAGTEQHFLLASLGAAMTRRPMVRVATTGVSALVGEDGLVSWRLPMRTGAVALLDVVPPRRDALYVHGGRTGVPLLVVVVALAAIALPARVAAADVAACAVRTSDVARGIAGRERTTGAASDTSGRVDGTMEEE